MYKDKAVSPIIATILLVAITVILASTLYIALGGFFSHTASAAPTASISATNTTSSISTTATSNNYTYTIGIGSVSSSTVPWSSTEWSVTINGALYTVTWISASTGWTYSSSTAGQPSSITVSAPSGTYVTGATLSMTITYSGTAPVLAPGPITTLA
ncbi:MAG: archaellin/type IV pilin N-terminal domain-containing protein, partial [Thermoplasmata archaeon]